MEPNKFPDDFVTNLSKKTYIKDKPNFGTNQVNILSFGLGNKINELFTNCTMISSTVGENMEKKIWKCGETSVIDLDNIKKTSSANEELEIMITGQREWGKQMRPSGWFSDKLFDRRYGRDDYEFSNEPHGIIVNINDSNISDFNKDIYQPNNTGVKKMEKKIKNNFIENHFSWWTNKIKEESYKKGKKEKSVQNENATIIIKDSFEIKNQKIGECQKSLKDILVALEICNKKIEKEYKKGFDDGFVKGYDKGLNQN